MNVIISFCGLCLLLALGKWLRVRVRLFQKLYLPSSVLGGILGLLFVQALGERVPAEWTAGWGALPGILINIVFASLFLGVAIPPLREVWRQSGPQLAYGQIVAWGQYVVGLGLVLLLLTPLFGVPALFGVIVPVGFEGGHGTASGLAATFQQLNWADGRDLGLASATAGIVSAVVLGVVLINWAARRGFISGFKRFDEMTEDELAGVFPPSQRPPAGLQTVSPASIDALALHLAIIGIAILIGMVIKQGLVWLELRIPLFATRDIAIMRAFPLFPLCMLGGLAMQLGISRFSRHSPVDHGLMQRLGGTALDFLVVAAISTIRLDVVARGFLPFAIIVAGGILWNVFCVMWLARRLLPDAWFERAIAEMGQSMGVTATGLLLLRAVDPESRTRAASAFGYKQLLHEPFMGGGLWTSSAVLLVATRGAWPAFLISIGAIAAWLVVWALVLRRDILASRPPNAES
jgi:ESS family glutamate:Na+ symporter